MNVYSAIPNDLPEELVEVLAQNEGVRIERIVSQGHSSKDWYDQATHEFVMILQGEGKILFEKDANVVHLRTGDHCVIPAHCRHKVIWTPPHENTIWLAIHY